MHVPVEKERCVMKKYTLVVVDMQPCWPAANDPTTIKQVKRAVRKARRQNNPIVLFHIPYLSAMDEEGYPPVRKDIRRLVRGYKLAKEITKGAFEDGASKFIALSERKGFSLKRVRVCGVNTSGCVYAFVSGMVEELPKCKIKVLTGACNSHFGLTQRGDEVVQDGEWRSEMWEFFERLPGVKLAK